MGERLEDTIDALDVRGKEFIAILDIMARKVASLRNQEGALPYDLFVSAAELAGVNICIEVIVSDAKGIYI